MLLDEVTGLWVFTHSVTVEIFTDYVGTSADYDGYDLNRLTRAVASSYALVDDYLSNAYKALPDALYDQVILEVALEVYKRQNSTNGQDASLTYESGGAPTRGPKDPMTQVYPTLKRFCSGGFA